LKRNKAVIGNTLFPSGQSITTQAVKYWAFRVFVAVAKSCKMTDGIAQAGELRNIGIKGCHMIERNGFYFATRAGAVLPKPEQFLDPFNRETQIPRPANEAQRVHIGIKVFSVTAV